MLSGRSQRIKIGNSFSTPQPVTSGVPQGSVLGPVLFIFYVNDITQAVTPPSVSKLYADDLEAYCPQLMMMKVEHLIPLWPKLSNGQMIGSYQFQQKNPSGC